WRVTLFRVSDAEYRLIWTYSHAILDSSFAEVLREVFVVYDALRADATPELESRPPYRDHILWLQDDLRTRAAEIAAFWREHLAGFATPTNLDAVQLPAAHGDTAPAGHDTVRFRLSRDT